MALQQDDKQQKSNRSDTHVSRKPRDYRTYISYTVDCNYDTTYSLVNSGVAGGRLNVLTFQAAIAQRVMEMINTSKNIFSIYNDDR